MNKRILIADDEVDLVSLLRMRLESHGYTVFTAHDGLEAVEKAQTERLDLIILDWKMPLGKGSAVLEMLHERETTKGIPVIVLTGASEPGLRKTAKGMGAKAFIRKPYEIDSLLGTIQSILS